MTSGTAPGAGIRLSALRELWVHTGTACNLSCPFCHEGSRPGDTRLEALTLAELRPHLDAAAAAGVEQFAFTGGEPLILKDIVAILRHALSLKPCLVLTNGTAPLIRRPHHLAQLQGLAQPLRFRVSIDYADEARHDAGRGYRNFRKALQGLKLLSDAGFAVGITRQCDAGEDPLAVAHRFRQLLRKQGLPEDVPVVAIPELGPPGRKSAGSNAGDADAAGLPTAAATACSRSRMLLRRDGQLLYSPCPLVDDEPRMDLGTELAAALTACVQPTHARCLTCLTGGVDYLGTAS
jgi:uncharacterized Fe-S cluster-containing radical SAM superfamily protein